MQETNRYHRQEILKHFGLEGQQALARSSVLVIGAGGLGCPVLQYLVAAGVGRVCVVDDDIVDMTNLHRQVLFGQNDIGKSKAETAGEKLRALNNTVTIECKSIRVGKENALSLISDFDLVMDCSDNFSTRYLVNDACVIKGKPLVYGAVSRFEGQVAMFNVDGSGNYRDLFPEIPDDDEVNNCAETGVLGVLPGVIGSLMATEALKFLSGAGSVLSAQLLTYSALTNQFLLVSYSKSETYSGPVDEQAFMLTDYSVACSIPSFEQLMQQPDVVVVDVREHGELPEVEAFPHVKIPVGQLEGKLSELSGKRVVLFCRSGSRSSRAAKMLREHGFEAYHVILDLGGLASMI